jgi:hypothetical protein
MLRSDPQKVRAWRARSEGLKRRKPMKDAGFTTLHVVSSDGAAVLAFPERRASRSRDTIPASVRRIVAARDLGMCVHCGRVADHQHHRRIKGMGGSTDPHANCPCVLVSLCAPCHSWVHLEASRAEALAEGLIIPRATPMPRLLPVLVHGFEDGGGQTAWPTCGGQWLSFEPSGGNVA